MLKLCVLHRLCDAQRRNLTRHFIARSDCLKPATHSLYETPRALRHRTNGKFTGSTILAQWKDHNLMPGLREATSQMIDSGSNAVSGLGAWPSRCDKTNSQC